MKTMTQERIRQVGLKALERELGPVGMARFLQQFETGQGNYSVERHRWLGKESVKSVVSKIRRQRLGK